MKRQLFIALGLVMLLGVSMWVGAAETAIVARIYYKEMADIEEIQQRYTVDLHEYNNRAEQYVLAGMSFNIYEQMLVDGWQVLQDDVATAASRRTWKKRTAAPNTFYGGYRTTDGIITAINDAAAAYPDITEKIDYGDSYCKLVGGCVTDEVVIDGYDLLAIRVGNKNKGIPSGEPSRPALILLAGIHPREISTSEQALFFLDYLTSNYGNDSDITSIIDWQDIYIIPMANPDGHYIVETVNAPGLQRKNAHIDYTYCEEVHGWASSQAQPGIDLNRNHSFGWNTGGSEDWECGLTYRGSYAASEPEVAGLEAFVRTVVPDQRGMGITESAPIDTQDILVSLHSYGNLVLYPWGNVADAAPNEVGLKQISDKLGALSGYTSQRSIDLYTTSGTTDDWAYGELGIPSFTIEIGHSFDGFFPPYSVAKIEHWNEIRETLLYAARIAATPYQQAQGPDVTMLTTAVQGQTMNVTATVDDTQNGEQSINQVVMTFNAPINNLTYQMLLSGNVISGTTDTATLTFDNCLVDLSPGNHTIHVRGQDSDGHWGPTWTTTVTIEPEFCNSIPLTLVYLPIVSQQGEPLIMSSIGLMTTILIIITSFLRHRVMEK